MKKYFILAIGAAALMSFLPTSAYAFDVSLDSISPSEGITDISDMVGPPPGEEVLQAFNYTSEKGAVEYTAVFNVTDTSVAPFFLGLGAEVISTEYTEVTDTTGQLTIVFTTQDFFVSGVDTSSNFMFAIMEPTADPTQDAEADGPPAAMAGGYISTSISNFQIMPPEGPSTPGFGLTLDGPVGEAGTFKMYMPAAMLTLMSQMSGTTLTYSDLAVFIDDQQASISITEASDGGVMIDISVVFDEDSTVVTSPATSTTRKEIVTKEKEPLSLALQSSTINKKKKVQAYGWTKNTKKGQKVKVLMKKEGKKKFTKVRVVKTDENGKYMYSKKMNKKGTYYFKTKLNKTKSSELTLEVL